MKAKQNKQSMVVLPDIKNEANKFDSDFVYQKIEKRPFFFFKRKLKNYKV